MRYAIRFDFPEGAVYAGEAGDSLGFAPTLATALMFEDPDVALRFLTNGYGEEVRSLGQVVTVEGRE